MAAAEIPEAIAFDELDIADGFENPWQVVLYPCDCHTYEQIIKQLMLAIQCTCEYAYELAWIAEHHGRAAVYLGKPNECQRVVQVLREIALHAEAEET